MILTKAKKVRDNLLFQVNKEHLFAYNMVSGEWRYFSDLLHEWVIIDPAQEDDYQDYIEFLIQQCKDSKLIPTHSRITFGGMF